MSAYLKIMPAVLLDPDVLFLLGQKICIIVRDTLLLDPRMEDICSAIEREGRTLCEVLSRTSPLSTNLDQATISCEKACSLLKFGIQLNLLQDDAERHAAAINLISTLENSEKHLQKNGYDISGDRIRDIIVNLESDQMQQALLKLNLQTFFDTLKEKYRQFEIVQIENEINHKPEALPTLRSTVSLYGMLIDTLIANVRFENYRLLHRVEPVLARIETAVTEAMETVFKQNKELNCYINEETITI